MDKLSRTRFAQRAARLIRTAITILAASSWQLVLAQPVNSLIFEIPAVQGPGTQGFGIVSDPTIQPFLGPGIPADLSLTLPIDLQGNGRPDVLACQGTFPPHPKVKAPCRLLRPQPDGTVIDITRKLLGTGTLPSVEHPREIVFGDFNHDGRPDIFIAAHGYDAPPADGETNILLVSNPDGTYSDRSSTLPQVPDFSHSACVGDIDGDGNLDIYVGNIWGSGQIGPYFLMGKGDGTFTQRTSGLPPQILGLQEKFTSCSLVDVDQDGHPDLVLGTHNDNGFVDSIVLFNDGTGDFTKRPRYVLPPGPLGRGTSTVMDILQLDINRDGRPDLILTSQMSRPPGGFALQILINQGNGIFADETSARLSISPARATGLFCAFLRLADFNGDGWEDFYCDTNGWDESNPRMWLNNRNGTWTPVAPASLPRQSTLGMMHAVDFDGDGRPDLLQMPFGPASPDISYRSWLNRTPRTVPSEPIIGAVIAGNAQATVFFTPPLGNGTSAITSYSATCSPGTFTGAITVAGSGSPITVSGLSNGKFYACSVVANSASGNSLASASVTVRPAAGLHTVLEFYNPTLDNFFITANPPEQVAVASGAAGADWKLTGVRFNAGGLAQVCRFYGSLSPGPNSHFYTIDPNECQELKDLQAATPGTQKRWNFESNDFASAAPVGGQCASGTVPVYRAYNNGFTRGIDSNHRITANQQAYQAQITKGWNGEGVVMCAVQ